MGKVHPMQGAPRLVMHVDDDPQILRLVARVLKQQGYETISVQDPALALDHLMNQHCRVVLCDVDMPGINGIELLRKIKKQDGGVQVIMLTGLVSTSTVLESMRAGAEACFFKPLGHTGPLVDALRATFTKVDRWWASLRDLAQRKHVELGDEAQPGTVNSHRAELQSAASG